MESSKNRAWLSSLTVKSQEELTGYNFKGDNIQVHYCIQGVNAINIYMKVVNAVKKDGAIRGYSIL
jgi:hypothetical protein